MFFFLSRNNTAELFNDSSFFCCSEWLAVHGPALLAHAFLFLLHRATYPCFTPSVTITTATSPPHLSPLCAHRLHVLSTSSSHTLRLPSISCEC